MTREDIWVGVGAASLVLIVLVHLGGRGGDGPSKQQDVRLCKRNHITLILLDHSVSLGIFIQSVFTSHQLSVFYLLHSLKNHIYLIIHTLVQFLCFSSAQYFRKFLSSHLSPSCLLLLAQ